MATILPFPTTAEARTVPERDVLGEVIEFDRAHPSRALGRLHKTLTDLGEAMPTRLGWAVVGRDDTGQPSRWFLQPRRAYIGYLDQWPQIVFLDHDGVCQTFACSPTELAVRFELDLLPTPLDEVR